MRVLREYLDEEKKCGGCNWGTATVYSFPGTDIREDGMCATCFMDMIVEAGLDVKFRPGEAYSVLKRLIDGG